MGVGDWVSQFALGLRCVVRLTASREARLGSRKSECVVASRVGWLGGGCFNLRWSYGASRGWLRRGDTIV